MRRQRTYYSKIKTKGLDTSCILVIPDQHMPYHHPDMLPFLKAVKKKFKPSLVVNLGDEVDKHAMSFHDSDPDLMSAGDELDAAIDAIHDMEAVFPEMILIDSNHGSLALRKVLSGGISRHYLRRPEEVYETEQWVWTQDLTLTLPNKQRVYFCHGKSKNGLKLSQTLGMCTVQGHYHNEFRIDYHSNPDNLLWSLQPGCLIDKKSLAFAYNKLTVGRPILGCGVIKDSLPMLIPMILNKRGRWTGKLGGV